MNILSQINSPNNEMWIQHIGKYILNMGAIEMLSRVIIAKINETENVAVFSAPLGKRLEYLSVRLNINDIEKRERALALFDVLKNHLKFRNTIAHSGIIMNEINGEITTVGIMNFTPDDPENIGNIISIEELRGRVDEIANIANLFLELQNSFSK